MASSGGELWKRTRVGAAVLAGVAALLWATDSSGRSWPVLAIGVALAVWGILELSAMAALAPRAALVLGATAALAGAALLVERTYAQQVGLLFAGAALGCVLARLVEGRRRGPELALAWGLVVALPGLFLVHAGLGTRGLVGVILLSKIGDVAGYYVGSTLGRKLGSGHPFPRISPKKTTVGCAASLLTAVLAGGISAAAGMWPPPGLGALSGWLWGGLLNLASQAGDLLESAVKRRAQVKDSGRPFGPSGGLLDLVDSLLLCVPTALVAGRSLFDWS